jgi:sugar/nucleoside kinase (ribokinase family)
MSLLVVGSVALDGIETPTERRENVLGGSAVHFSYAASFFAKARIVGVVGEDWPVEHTQMLIGRGIDVSGLKTVPGGKTFRWTGKYHQNMNDRDTLEVHLNVLADFNPQLPESYRDSKFVFLGNAAPSTQLKVLEQVPNATLSVADTMDLWINIQRDELRQLLTKIDGLVLNDNEAKLLADDENLVRAGQKVLAMGPKFIVIKKGEHGAMFFSAKEKYMMPAYPTSQVVDPTGAGDSFAGGMMGYLAEQGKIEPRTLKHALAYGTVVASYNVEDFSLDRLKGLQRADVDRRFNEYREMLTF